MTFAIRDRNSVLCPSVLGGHCADTDFDGCSASESFDVSKVEGSSDEYVLVLVVGHAGSY